MQEAALAKEIKMPKGVKEPGGKVRISTVFDKDVFNELCRRGKQRGTSFSDAANDAAKCGILCLEEAGE